MENKLKRCNFLQRPIERKNQQTNEEQEPRYGGECKKLRDRRSRVVCPGQQETAIQDEAATSAAAGCMGNRRVGRIMTGQEH